MQGNRVERTEALLKSTLSELILMKMKDPRLGFVTVTGVEMSPDLKHARVGISVLGGEKEKSSTIAALQHAHGYLQKEVARILKLRFTPAIEFRLDESLDHSLQIRSILKKLKEDGELGEGNQSQKAV